jgi:hypothetical protein
MDDIARQKDIITVNEFYSYFQLDAPFVSDTTEIMIPRSLVKIAERRLKAKTDYISLWYNKYISDNKKRRRTVIQNVFFQTSNAIVYLGHLGGAKLADSEKPEEFKAKITLMRADAMDYLRTSYKPGLLYKLTNDTYELQSQMLFLNRSQRTRV